MKKSKKLSKAGPTITDVMGAVQDLAGTVQDLTEAVQVGFERHEGILKVLVEGQDDLRESVHLLDQRVSKTQNRIEDVVDEHQDTLVGHGRRITVLEKARV